MGFLTIFSIIIILKPYTGQICENFLILERRHILSSVAFSVEYIAILRNCNVVSFAEMLYSWNPFMGKSRGYLESIIQRVYELIIQILSKFIRLWLENEWFDQLTILHKSRQLSFSDKCKFVSWLNHQNHDYSQEHFWKICSIMSS